MKIFGVHFHNWTAIYDTHSETFLSEYVAIPYKRFRYCSECGTCQELDVDYWCTLLPEQAIILTKKVYEKNGKLFIRKE